MTHLPTLVLLVLVGMLTACSQHAVLPVVLGVGNSFYRFLAPLHSMSESDCHTTYSVASLSESHTPTSHVTISADFRERTPSHTSAVCKATSMRKPMKALPSRRLLLGVGAPPEIGKSRNGLGKLPDDLLVFFQF